MRDIAFATYAGEPNLAADDRPLLAPLERLGLRVVPVRWNEEPVPEGCSGLVFRSCWNYDAHEGEFLRWLDELEARKLRCCNPISQVRWNFHKRYLLDLERRGARLPPTRLLGSDERTTLAALLRSLDSSEAVVKPAVSMCARDTYRLSLDRPEEGERLLAAARRRGEVLVQAFVAEIQTEGETSLVFFGGEYSHAVRKRPAPGDFRSQAEHGGVHVPIEPAAAIVRQAREILACLDERPTIARVDGVEVGGQLLLMELELIDPSLHLDGQPAAVERCARALAGRLA